MGGSLNLEPIGNNELARLAGVDKATASAFFRDEFKSHSKYKASCRNSNILITSLKLLNKDISPTNSTASGQPGKNEVDPIV